MKINITRDENGRIIAIDALSESSDGHLSSEEKQILTDVLNNDHEESLKKIEEDSKTEQKKIEEESKAKQKKIEEESKTKQKMYEESTAKHKEWASTSSTIITGFCKAVVDYLEEKEIAEATKTKEPEFDTSVDHLDLTGPKDEESKPQIEDYEMSMRRDKFAS